MYSHPQPCTHTLNLVTSHFNLVTSHFNLTFQPRSVLTPPHSTHHTSPYITIPFQILHVHPIIYKSQPSINFMLFIATAPSNIPFYQLSSYYLSLPTSPTKHIHPIKLYFSIIFKQLIYKKTQFYHYIQTTNTIREIKHNQIKVGFLYSTKIGFIE